MIYLREELSHIREKENIELRESDIKAAEEFIKGTAKGLFEKQIKQEPTAGLYKFCIYFLKKKNKYELFTWDFTKSMYVSPIRWKKCYMEKSLGDALCRAVSKVSDIEVTFTIYPNTTFSKIFNKKNNFGVHEFYLHFDFEINGYGV